MSRNCRSRIKCLACKGQHHVAICPNKSCPRAEDSTPSSGFETTTTLNPEASPYNPPTTSTLWTSLGNTGYCIQSRLPLEDAESSNCDGHRQPEVLHYRVREQLALTTAGERCLTIATFGATQGGRRVYKYVKVGLKLKSGLSQTLTLFSVPTICEPLTCHPLVDCREAYPHLSGLEFADELEDGQELHVDILVGSDCYWDLITGRIQRGSDGPVAIDTKLRWVLSGPISIPGNTDASLNLMTHALLGNSQHSEEQTLDETMKSFWELESFGIPATDRSLYDEFRDS